MYKIYTTKIFNTFTPIIIILLCCMSEHPLNGSPVYPFWQMHCGTCLTVLQVAYIPHEPGHGSRHFSFTQARFPEHSALIVHSGRQFGGRPI